MDEDDLPRRRDYPLSPSKMSKTPSWIMLGFVLGALFVLALPQFRKKAERPDEMTRPPVLEFTKPSGPRQPQPLTTIEDVFGVWSQYAVWSDDTTEVAFWNKEYQDFTDLFEVRRVGNAVYFRTIPRLTRRILNHGKLPPDSPFRFTETEEQYREWLEHGRAERPVERGFLLPRAPAPVVSPTVDPGSTPTLPPPDAPRFVVPQGEKK